MAPSPFARRLYACPPHYSHMNPGVETMVLVFYRLVSKPILQNIANVTNIVS